MKNHKNFKSLIGLFEDCQGVTMLFTSLLYGGAPSLQINFYPTIISRHCTGKFKLRADI